MSISLVCNYKWSVWLVYHTIIRAAFVCLWVYGCVPYLLRGPLTDLRQTWWVYVGGPRNCPWGVLFRKGQRVDGSMGHFRFPLYYIGISALVPQLQSLIRCLLLLHINGICRWTSQLLLRGSFSKRSTGQRINGSNGSTGHFHFHCIIYDSRRRQAHPTLLQKAHGVWWHQSHATPLQKAHSVFCSLDG